MIDRHCISIEYYNRKDDYHWFDAIVWLVSWFCLVLKITILITNVSEFLIYIIMLDYNDKMLSGNDSCIGVYARPFKITI